MPRISIDNYDTVASWNGSQDLFVVEQPDGTKVATPAMVKQFIEAGDFEATGEVKDGHGNILKDMAKSAIIGDLSQTGLTGDSVAEQLGDAKNYVDNAVSTAMDNCKMAVFSKTITGLNVNAAWGSLYESDTQTIDISSMGLSSAPKGVLIGGLSASVALIPKLGQATSTQVKFGFVRPTTVTNITATMIILVLY